MSTHDDFQQEPVPQGKKSSGNKVLLILGTIAGLGLVLCCGGPAIVYVMFKDAIVQKIKNTFDLTTDPEEVKGRSEEIAHLDIPENYTPVSAVRFSIGFTMKMIVYQSGSNNQGALVLMEMEMNQPGMDRKQMREQMLQQMRSQQANGGPGGFNSQIVAQSTETKTFKVNGEDVEFDFVKGTRPGDSSGTIYRQVTGTFQGKNGIVMLMLFIPDSEYDEEAVSKMIQSIRVTGSEPATEPSAESRSDEDMPEEGAAEKVDDGSAESETAPDKSE